MTNAPGYWMNETSGQLAPVVRAYLAGTTLTPNEVATMRAYLRQWVADEGFVGDDVDALRQRVDSIRTHDDVRRWLSDAYTAGIDPL